MYKMELCFWTNCWLSDKKNDMVANQKAQMLIFTRNGVGIVIRNIYWYCTYAMKITRKKIDIRAATSLF